MLFVLDEMGSRRNGYRSTGNKPMYPWPRSG